MNIRKLIILVLALVVIGTLIFSSCGEPKETTTAPPPTSSAPPTSSTPPTSSAPTTSVKPPLTTTAPPPATVPPQYGGTIRIITPLDPTVLGDVTEGAGRATFFQYCVNERLVVYAPDVWQNQDFEGVLATDWEIKNDMKTYEFTLRKGVKFHDGADWNAEACKWNLDLQKENGKNSTWNDMLSCQILDDYKVRINFSTPKNTFMVLASTGCYFMSPKSFMAAGDTLADRKAWAADHPVGTGPFKLKEVMRGAYVKYERFDDYWRGKPYLDGVEFMIVPDPTVSAAMMEAGDADMYVYSDLKASIDLDKKEGFTARYRDKHSPQGIWPQAQDPESVWYDKRVREALGYAINREAIVKALNMGTNAIHVMYQLPIGPEDPAYREGWGRKYDPEKAKALLDEAGLSSGFECDIYNNSATPILGDMAVMIQSNLADVGIKVNINTISPGQYMTYLLFGWPTGNILISGLPNEPIPYSVALMQYRCEDLNLPKWNHDTATTPEMCRLYKILEDATTPETIEAAYIALSNQAMDDAYGCLIMDWPDTAVMADYVHTDWISYSTKVWNADQTWMEPH